MKGVIFLLLVYINQMSFVDANEIHNENIKLTYNPNHATSDLVLQYIGPCIGPPETQFTLCDSIHPPACCDIWEVEFYNPSDHSTINVKPSTASSKIYSYIEDVFEPTLTATWDNVTAAGLDGHFKVVVTATINSGDSVADLYIEVITIAVDNHSVFSIKFPIVSVYSLGAGQDEILTCPLSGGLMLRNPVNNSIVMMDDDNKPQYNPGQYSMQWFSYYNGSLEMPDVLYTGTRDTLGYHKQYILESESSAYWSFTVRHYPENNIIVDTDYSSPYSCVIGYLKAERDDAWFDAAKFYREWAIDNLLFYRDEDGNITGSIDPICDNEYYSEIIKNGKMFGIIKFSESDQHLTRWNSELMFQRSYIGVDSIPSLVYRWFINNDRYGEWDYRRNFKEEALLAVVNGNDYGFYFNNNYYDSDGDSYMRPIPGYPEGVGPYVMAEYFPETFNDDNIVTAPKKKTRHKLCRQTHFMSDYTRHYLDKLDRDAGSRGVYLDAYSWDNNGTINATAFPDTKYYNTCFDSSHDHFIDDGVIGGGKYYTQSKIMLAKKMHEHMNNGVPGTKDYFIYSEAQAESYIGVIEIVGSHHLTNCYAYPKICNDSFALPIYNTVYNDYQVQTKMECLLENEEVMASLDNDHWIDCRRYTACYYSSGHAPWAGSEIQNITTETYMDNNPLYKDLVDMIKNIMNVLKLEPVRNYMTFGEMMRNPVINQGNEWIVPYENEENAFYFYRPYVYGQPAYDKQPVIYTSAYRNYKEGGGSNGFSLLFLNWTMNGDILNSGIPESPVYGGDKQITYNIYVSDYGFESGTYLKTTWYSDDIITEYVEITDNYTEELNIDERSAIFIAFEPVQ